MGCMGYMFYCTPLFIYCDVNTDFDTDAYGEMTPCEICAFYFMKPYIHKVPNLGNSNRFKHAHIFDREISED